MRNTLKFFFTFIILGLSAACQPTFVPVSVTPVALPVVQVTARPTQTPHLIALPTGTPIPPTLPSPTPFPGDALIPEAQGTPASPTPLIIAQSLLPSPVPTDSRPIPTLPTLTPLPVGTPSATPVLTQIPGGSTFLLGTSVEGRDIWAWHFGSGEHIVLLVGGVHTGFEANTVALVNEMILRFESTPADVMPGVTLVLVPVLNPDGLAVGRRAEGRFNAHGIDLNRNWGCDWSAESHFKNQLVDPGPRAFSEPESTALARWIRAQRPAAAIFYHSAANGVFAGDCNGDHTSDALAAVLGEATGYPYGKPFTAYPVNGTESNWADGLGIPAVDVELSGTRDSEFQRNIKGVLAVQCWVIGTQC
jgi:Zinc carboxypeptidase